MKIAFFTRSLPFHQSGGMEEVAWDFAKGFASLGHEVTVFTTRGQPPSQLPERLRVLCLEAPSGRYSLRWWLQSLLAYHRVKASQDVVMGVGGGARALALSPRKNAPLLIAQAHGTAWGEFCGKLRLGQIKAILKSPRNLLAMFEDLTYRRFDAMIAVGPSVAKALGTRPTSWIIGKTPVHVIENGIPLQSFGFSQTRRVKAQARLGLRDSDRLILMASRLHAQKGLFEGLQAFEIAATRDSALHLAIAGSGPLEAKLQEKIVQSPQASRIHFLGHIPRAELPLWTSAADIFLLPTRARESGIPLSILEAMAAGLPILTSPEIAALSPHLTACDPRDPANIAAKLLDLPQPPLPRASLLPQNRDLHHSLQAYLALFERLLTQRQTR